MENSFIIQIENELQGFKTRIKELHYSASSMALHKLIDEFDKDFHEFDDALMEGSQAIWGTIKPGTLEPDLPESMDFLDLLSEIRSLLARIKNEAGESLIWTGLVSTTDSFFEKIGKYIYLAKICERE